MISVLVVPAVLLLVLSVTRRALEPECPNCAGKTWAAHSTQLQCVGCGWTNGRLAVAPAQLEPAPVAVPVAVAVPAASQYEIGFHG